MKVESVECEMKGRLLVSVTLGVYRSRCLTWTGPDTIDLIVL